jgi:hypothetical protein
VLSIVGCTIPTVVRAACALPAATELALANGPRVAQGKTLRPHAKEQNRLVEDWAHAHH